MDVHSTGLIAAVAVLAAASIFGLWRRRTDGAVRAVGTRSGSGSGTDSGSLTADELGRELGRRITFVQFSSPVCRPCEATRRILSEASADAHGVVHVDLDTETRLDLVQRFNILRTPTVLVLDSAGRVAHRISGAPRPAAVRSVIEEGLAAAA